MFTVKQKQTQIQFFFFNERKFTLLNSVIYSEEKSGDNGMDPEAKIGKSDEHW